MKPERLFYTSAGAIFLVLTVIGFQHYIFGGRHFDGSPIDPTMLTTVVLHSSAIFAWYLLFFVQALLISTHNRRLHMKLGWSVLVIASAIAVSAPLVAVRSLRLVPNAVVFDWPGPPFLLILFTEAVLYTTFVVIGVLYRKQPRIHRPMMLLASLTILTGATGRIPLVNSIFGFHTWMALFGPVAFLGGLLMVVRIAMTRSLDRAFAVGYAALVLITLTAAGLAQSNSWVALAGGILRP